MATNDYSQDLPVTEQRTAWIALGSNQSSAVGDSTQTVLQAIQMLENIGFHVGSVSRFFANPAFPAGSGPDYTNAVVDVTTDWPVLRILDELHTVEARLGRKRDVRWAARTVDLDLLAVGDVVYPNAQVQNHWRSLPLAEQMRQTPDDLILPHPRLQDRAFVLVPMAEIAPNWRHPLLEKTVLQMLNDLPQQDKDQVIPSE